MEKKLKILIVEDEVAILSGLIDLFVFHGYEVESTQDGNEALQMAQNGEYDLIVLDVMLPSLDGFSICNEIRKTDREQPIVMLTAKSSEEDIITGLTLGADDYIAKPFSVRELVLRVESVLRRSQKRKNLDAVLAITEDLRIDTKNLAAVGEGKNAADSLAFTRREVEILQYLHDNADRPVPREELLAEVWGYQRAANIETRTVDIHIAKLRRKIEKNPKKPRLLVTVRGEGYRLLSNDAAT